MKIRPLDFELPLAEIEKKIDELNSFASDKSVDFSAEIARLKDKGEVLAKEIYADLNAWQITQVARHPQRPYFLDYVDMAFENFIELHGDRQFSDDQSTVTGVAYFHGTKVALIGQQRGRDVEENKRRNFGSPYPEGYRKALKMMKFAEKFHLPVITFINTQGAFPGLEAEERGQGEAIARNLREMSALKVPVVVIVVGEGGSGGALGIGVGDRILMMQNSIYSVISPEGCASILWRDATKAETAAEALKITAPELLKLGIIDEIIPEPLGGAHRNYEASAKSLAEVLGRHLKELQKMPVNRIVEKRHEKFRAMGPVSEN